MCTSNRDGRGAPAETDDRILVLENRAYVPSATRNATTISFEFFPDPARHQATLRLPALGARITVCDLLGRHLREQAVPGTTATLDLTGLSAGRYLGAVVTAVGTAKRRIGPWQFFCAL